MGGILCLCACCQVDEAPARGLPSTESVHGVSAEGASVQKSAHASFGGRDGVAVEHPSRSAIRTLVTLDPEWTPPSVPPGLALRVGGSAVVDSTPDLQALRAAAESYAGGGDTVTLAVQSENWHFSLRLDEDIWDADARAGVVDTAELVEHARELMALVGADPGEMEIESGLLKAFGGEIGAPSVVRDVAHKVHVLRRIEGIPVHGDYVVITFALNGGFAKMLGTWRPIDRGRSVFVSGFSSDELLDLAADRLAEQAFVPRPSVYAIEVGIHYYFAESDPSQVAYRLEPRGYAVIRDADGNGMGQEGKAPVKYFSLTTNEARAADGRSDSSNSSEQGSFGESSSGGGEQAEELEQGAEGP